jgi:hypothetical protein
VRESLSLKDIVLELSREKEKEIVRSPHLKRGSELGLSKEIESGLENVRR